MLVLVTLLNKQLIKGTLPFFFVYLSLPSSYLQALFFNKPRSATIDSIHTVKVQNKLIPSKLAKEILKTSAKYYEEFHGCTITAEAIEYAVDLSLKKKLVINQFAAKELYTAKYYINVQKWVPAINRLKFIVTEYDNTIFIEEALHRLVEINYYLGLEKEAKKYAKILGYNYNSSQWFEQSYKILNKDYKIKKKKVETKKESGFLKKILKKIK